MVRGLGFGRGPTLVRMDVAAIVIAVFALLVSAVPAWVARKSAAASERSAQAAEATVDIDRERRHGELVPDLDVGRLPKIGAPDGGTWEGFGITNRGPLDYDHVTVTLVSSEHGPVKGLRVLDPHDGDAFSDTVSLGPVPRGEGPLVLCENHDPRRGGPLRLRAECVAGDDRWEQVLEIAWPSRGAVFV